MNTKLLKPYAHLILLLALLLPVKTLWAQSQTHPSIWVNDSDKAVILDNIAKYSWAKELNDQLHTRNDSIVALHKISPQTYMNSRTGFPGDRYNHLNALTRAAECAMLYYLTGNTDYAQFAADVFQYYTKNISVQSSVNLHNNYFIESRACYPKIGITYDFIYHFLKDPNTTIYDRNTGTRVPFDNNAAQITVKKLADAVFNKETLRSNHSILEGNGALYNLLCIEDDAVRETYFNKFLHGTSHQDAFIDYTLASFSPEDGIWPESVSYSKGPQKIVLQMMNVVDRYRPSLNIIADNLRIIDGTFLFEELDYPNNTVAVYGDSRRDIAGVEGLYRQVLWITKRKDYSAYTDKVLKSLKRTYDSEGGYHPTITTQTLEWDDPLDLFWGVNVGDDITPSDGSLSTSAKVSHAGIMLQRNYNGENEESDGLVGYIGGAHYVHSHLTGIDMELYGKGYVMGSGGGDTAPDNRAAELYTDYYRIYAGHNTVVVNGKSVGQGAGSWKSDGLLYQNTAVNIAAEPASRTAALSKNFSFATQFLDDNVNDVDQQRTLSLVRTGPHTAYYVDIFRSKSNGTNNFHDYIYHNLGDDYMVTNLDGSSMVLTSTPDRFPINPVTYNGHTVNFPGWQYFENPETSAPSTTGAKVTFTLNSVTPTAYMYMLLPGGESREYTKALAPPTLETDANYLSKKANVIVVRQNGEAWNKPFISVFEPSGETTSSVNNVENIVDNNVIIGAKVTSVVDGETIVDYIISQPDAAGTYTNSALNFSFSGRFGILRIGTKATNKRVSMYIGEGAQMSYDGHLLTADASKKGLLEYGAAPSSVTSSFIPEKIEIEAEDYNTGGQGVGYNDQDGTDTSNNTTYRTDAADLINTSNASNGISISSFAGNVNNNNADWMKYTFNVTNAGNYKLSIIAARGGSGVATNAGQFNMDDGYFVKTVDIASTGDGNTFAKNDLADLVYLSAGSHTLKYSSMVSKSHNPDKFIIERQDVSLPVSLIKFGASKKINGCLLNWETASEVNNSHFILYRSANGLSFEELARITAKNQASKYQYIDESPFSGNNYYKLVQVDFDGKSVELGIKALNFDLTENQSVIVYPNPADRVVNLLFGRPFENNVSIKLFNLKGEEVQKEELPLQNQKTNYSIELNKAITSGIYIINVKSGNYNCSKKVIVK
nr:T9SS type A sorting domain-containing protein [uncultured Pedobacter sp.]